MESRKNRIFTEGWVEFVSKRVARQIAATLNNTQVGGKHRSPWYSDIWNIKYLPRFTWGLLNERLAYERAIHKSRLRTEVAIVKRETEHFARSVKQAKRDKKLLKKNFKANKDQLQEENTAVTTYDHSAHRSQDTSSAAVSSADSQQLLSNKQKGKPPNSDLLRNIFSGGFQR